MVSQYRSFFTLTTGLVIFLRFLLLLDEVCSSFDCPDNYSSVDGADKIVCEDSGCTKKLCCEKDGEAAPE